jgi:hypothetical protein
VRPVDGKVSPALAKKCPAAARQRPPVNGSPPTAAGCNWRFNCLFGGTGLEISYMKTLMNGVAVAAFVLGVCRILSAEPPAEKNAKPSAARTKEASREKAA